MSTDPQIKADVDSIIQHLCVNECYDRTACLFFLFLFLFPSPYIYILLRVDLDFKNFFSEPCLSGNLFYGIVTFLSGPYMYT